MTHDYAREISLVMPDEGDYEFRLKFYIHEDNRTVYSPKYKLSVFSMSYDDPDEKTDFYYEGTITVIEQ